MASPMRLFTSFSFALEDVFALYLSNCLSGFFVDIGCAHPLFGSNSKLLESIGWSGICIDLLKHPDWDRWRSTRCHTLDATAVDYDALFRAENAPQLIDLLSIDVDNACYDALTLIPFETWHFKIVVVEHDFYRTLALRDPEREHLKRFGYELVCSDVIHEPDKPFEDWWVSARHFEPGLLETIRSHRERDIEIVRKFGHKNTICRLNGYHGSYPQLEIA
jgi:hypothetical protein